MLYVGFSEINITPPLGLPLAGGLRPYPAEGIKWPLFGRVAVFDNGTNRVAIVSLDLLCLLSSTVEQLRTALSVDNDLDAKNILIACSHTHRGPHTISLMNENADFAYLDFLQLQLVSAMRAAYAARQSARLKVAKIMAPGWTFNRRPIYKGGEVGTHGPLWVEDFEKLEGPADEQLQVLLAENADGKAIGGLVNFACHTVLMDKEHVYSADYPGPLTETLAKRRGCIFAFLQGASGNLRPVDMSDKSKSASQAGPEYTDHMGRGLADKVDESLSTAVEVANGAIGMAQTRLRIPQRRPTREQVKLARWYLEEAPSGIDQAEFTRRIYGHDHTFYGSGPDIQEWFMRETIGMWEWQRRVGTPELIEEVEVQVLAIGDVVFVAYPAEMFTEFGIHTKLQSPFPHTFVVELANGWHGYVPIQEAFKRGGYEPRLAYQSRLATEAGDQMTDAALRLLNGLAARQLSAVGHNGRA